MIKTTKITGQTSFQLKLMVNQEVAQVVLVRTNSDKTNSNNSSNNLKPQFRKVPTFLSLR